IAATAAQLLLARSWTGFAEVPVLGPEDLSPKEMAVIMSEVLGRTVTFSQTPLGAYKSMFLAQGHSEAIAQAMVDMAVTKANGLDQGVARTPQNSTPTTFRQWCAEVLLPAVEG
ncbi:MAG: NmrA family transcriptional regulator, partial [Microlunatus sp.]|nr:NmrA family transcriptional regulator [Microlunatus sp.]